MNKTQIGSLALIFAGLLSYLHVRALHESWYWLLPWFDVLMHFLGGVCVAFFLAYILLLVRGKFVYDEFLQTAFIVGGTFIVGVLWEVFEHVFNVVFDPIQSIDTVTDLFMDAIGALGVNWMLNLSERGSIDSDE